MAEDKATKAELSRQVEELQRALKDKAAFESSVLKAELGGNYTMVPIKNYGNTTVSIEYDYKGQTKVLILGTKDPKDLGAIPVEVWVELDRTSKLVSDGYIARTDLPITNPNVIPDDVAFLKSYGEAELVKQLSELTNVHVLQRLLKVVEGMGKSGKYLSAASAIKQRIFDVTETYEKKDTGELVSLNTGIRMIEEEE